MKLYNPFKKIRELRANVRELEKRCESDKCWRELHESRIHDLRRELLEAAARESEALRPVAWPKPADRLSDLQISEEIGADPGLGALKALHQLLDDEISDQLDKSTLPPQAGFTPAQREYAAGGAEALREFQGKLMAIHTRRAREDAQDDEQE